MCTLWSLQKINTVSKHTVKFDKLILLKGFKETGCLEQVKLTRIFKLGLLYVYYLCLLKKKLY